MISLKNPRRQFEVIDVPVVKRDHDGVCARKVAVPERIDHFSDAHDASVSARNRICASNISGSTLTRGSMKRAVSARATL